MENTKSVKSIKKDKNIVKLNKKKIIIIVFLVLVILAGISVGLYYAIRPASAPLPSDITWEKNEKKLEKDFEKHGQEGIVGIYIGAEGDDYTTLSLYGDDGPNDPDEDKVLDGPFSVYLDDYASTGITWYGLMEPSTIDASSDLETFFYDGDNEYGDPQVKWDNAIYLGMAEDNRINTLDNSPWAQANISFIPESTSEDDTTTDNDDNDYQLSFKGNGSVIATPSAPTWLWFKDGELIAVTSGVSTFQDDDGNLQIEDEVSYEYFTAIEEAMLDETSNSILTVQP